MPAVSLREILQPAFAARYGVGAFNIVNDLSMAAVLDAAVETKSPVIIQVSVKTVKMWGAKLLQQMFAEMASNRPVPATLHLDHCPDIEMIKTCLQAGWNSVLFDASSLSYQDNLRLRIHGDFWQRRKSLRRMERGLIFDCDGVLADTELHGHLVAFNQMWNKLGVPWQWSDEQYAEKLKIGGGKERMASLFLEKEFQQVFPVPKSEEERKALITRWHKEKTAIYQQIISSGAIPPRSGIKRIAESALAAGWKLGVASTSARPSVEAVLIHVVGESTAKQFAVFAGDVVAAKKPAPDIYLLAIKELGIAPGNCVAIEDSRNGLLSAHTAGMPVLVTTSWFTKAESFSEARLVISALGDPGGEQTRVSENRIGRSVGEYVKLEDLAAMVGIAE